MARYLKLLIAVGLIAWICRAALAGPNPQPTGTCPKACVPNVLGFGHFYQKEWRTWPGEPKIPAAAIGAKELPTPPGQKPVPLPKVVIPPRQTPPPPQAQGEPLQPPREILPPDLPRVPEGHIAPPTAPPMELPRPTDDGGLPGFESEPNGSILPGGNLLEGGLPSMPATEKKPKSDADKSRDAGKDSPPGDAPKPRGSSRQNGVTPRKTASFAAVELPAPDMAPEPKLLSQYRTSKPIGAPASQPRLAVEPGVKPLPMDATMSVEIPRPLTTSQSPSAVVPAVSEMPIERRSNPVEPAAYAVAESIMPAPVIADQSVVPSVALGGYCPVELARSGRWVAGDLRWTVVHQGHIYRLSGDAQRRAFLADPDAFAPVCGGNDPVLAVDENRLMPGKAAHCAVYEGRLYIFANSTTQAKFNKAPKRYTLEK